MKKEKTGWENFCEGCGKLLIAALVLHIVVQILRFENSQNGFWGVVRTVSIVALITVVLFLVVRLMKNYFWWKMMMWTGILSGVGMICYTVAYPFWHEPGPPELSSSWGGRHFAETYQLTTGEEVPALMMDEGVKRLVIKSWFDDRWYHRFEFETSVERLAISRPMVVYYPTEFGWERFFLKRENACLNKPRSNRTKNLSDFCLTSPHISNLNSLSL